MAHGLGAVALAGLVCYWLRTYGSLRWLALVPRRPAARRDGAGPLAAGDLCVSARGRGRARRRAGTQSTRAPHGRAGPMPAGGGRGLSAADDRLALRLWPLVRRAGAADRPALAGTVAVASAAVRGSQPLLLDAAVRRGAARPSPLPATAPCRAGGPAGRRVSLQVYALASLWGKGEFLDQAGNFAGAFLSRAYGMRHLTEAVVTLVPGLALLLELASGWRRGMRFPLFAVLGCLLASWNLILILQYNMGVLPHDAGAPVRRRC